MPDNISKKMDIIAELRIRQYFDHFLEETLPAILENHEQICPHGKQVNRIKWFLIGVTATLALLIPAFGKPLWAIVTKIH